MGHFTASVLYAVILLLVSPLGWADSPKIPTSSDRAALPGHVLPALSMAQPVAAPAMALKRVAEPLALTVVLRRSDPAGFEEYLRDVYDSQSPQYLKFLNPEEVSDQFGPSQADYDTVQAYFEQQGFTVTAGAENRMTLTIAGTRSTAEKALGVRIGDYMIGERAFFANVNDPSLPRRIAAKVKAVTGLTNLPEFQRPHSSLKAAEFFKECKNHEFGPFAAFCGYVYPASVNTYNALCTWPVIGWLGLLGNWEVAIIVRIFTGSWNFKPCQPLPTPTPTPNSAVTRSSADNASDSPRTIQANGISIPNNRDGSGQTIGIVAFDSFKMSDVSDFLAYMGAPATQINQLSSVLINGGAALGPDQDEVLMDINTVMVLAPNARVIVYSAPVSGAGSSYQAIFNRMVNDGVTIISNSWSYCEDQTTLADVQSIDTILATAAASGVSAFNASGDTGSTCLNGSPNTVGVPANSPHATAVGGTSPVLGPGGVYVSEQWWDGSNNIPPTGQGGFGVSRFFARPAYQDGFTPSATRSVPDIAVNADPSNGVVICQASAGGCPTNLLYGGTSFSAPLMASMMATLNQAQGRNLGLLNPIIYPLANTDAFHSAASMGSDFAHVGLGSPNLGVLNQLLSGVTPGLPNAALSLLVSVGSVPWEGLDNQVPADGSSVAHIVAQLRDANGHTVSGKNVTLTASPGSHAVISPASGVSTVDNGAVVFSITNTTVENVTFTATDTTDNIVLQQQATVSFVVPPAASAGISASPTSLLNNGVSTTTITVTLKDALNRPAPGKLITLSQGGGRSVITGPSLSVTDANGEIRFTATNQFSETVTYTAVNVTDGDLPVPGNATVTFSGSANLSCVGNPPTAAAGYALTPFANGFFTQNLIFGNVNWGCSGASNPTFSTTDSVYVANFATGDLFKFGLEGGVVSTGNKLSNLGRTLGQPTFGKDGRLYATHGATTGNSTTGDIVEIDPATGAQLRVIAANLTCPSSLAVDPLSGDLFFDNTCVGGGLNNPSLFRVRNPGSVTPTVEVYATLPTTNGNGAISFAPDGTIYVVINYFNNPNAPVVRVSGTDQPSPPMITTLTGITSNFWVTVGEANPDGSAKSLIVLSGVEPNLALTLVDITTNPFTSTPLTNGGIGSGVIGPDGCLYASATDTIYKLAPSSGGCGFAATNPAPALTLSPATVSPNPAQGSQQTMTAQFVNMNAPAGTPVFFSISGANAQTRLGRTDASGKATINYTGTFTGNDIVVASAAVGASDFTSNLARLTWAAGQHVTFLSLNTSPQGATVGVPVALSAALVDISVNPTAAIAGATIQFSVGGQSCSAVTNASGIASCTVTLPAAGSFALTANFAGGGQQQAAAASQTLFATAPITSPATCFTGAVTSGGQATACLASALPTCQFTNSAFVPVASVGVAPPTGIEIPYGLFQFMATGCGDAATLSITYPNPLPANASYWKFGPALGQPARWYALPAIINGSTLTVTLIDGGAGDSDLQANGSIVDPGGAGYAIAADGVPIPTLDEWRLLLFMLLLAAMVSMAASRRRSGRF